MNINKLTQRSLEAVQSAQSIAVSHNNQQVDQEHLCAALLGQEDSLIKSLIERMGSDAEGFAGAVKDYSLKVVIPEEWLAMVPESKREALRGVLAQDPRPGYRRGDARPFGVEFAGLDVRFTVENGVLTVFQIVKIS